MAGAGLPPQPAWPGPVSEASVCLRPGSLLGSESMNLQLIGPSNLPLCLVLVRRVALENKKEKKTRDLGVHERKSSKQNKTKSAPSLMVLNSEALREELGVLRWPLWQHSQPFLAVSGHEGQLELKATGPDICFPVQMRIFGEWIQNKAQTQTLCTLCKFPACLYNRQPLGIVPSVQTSPSAELFLLCMW